MKNTMVFLLLAAAAIPFAAAGASAQQAPFTPYASIRTFIGGVYENKYQRRPGTGIFMEKDRSTRGDIDFVEHLNAVSRLGVNFSKGALSGKAEIGVAANRTGGTPYLRHAYLTYKSSMGLEILAGQTDTPMNYPATHDGWNDSFLTGGFGSSNMGRLPQIKFTYSGVYLALISPLNLASNNNYYYVSTYPGAYGLTGHDSYMPRVAIGYDMKSQIFSGGLGFAGYQPYLHSNNNEFSYMVYVHGRIDVGAPFIKFNATVQHAPANMGMVSASGGTVNSRVTRPSAGNFHISRLDDTLFEGYVELGCKLPTGTVSVIGAYVQEFGKTDRESNRDNNTVGVELLYAHRVADGFQIVPSVLYVTHVWKHQGDPSSLEFGVKFQADL